MQIGDRVQRINDDNAGVRIGELGIVTGFTTSEAFAIVKWDKFPTGNSLNDEWHDADNLIVMVGQTQIGPGEAINLIPEVQKGPAPEFVSGFTIKDSGKREEFASGMVRDTAEGKTQYHRIAEGPMFTRWAVHLTKGAVKYPDNTDGTANWTRANGIVEWLRFKQSAFRHFMQWFFGATDEDHASAVFFNINGAEYTKEKMDASLPNRVAEKP